ncbi:MAG: dTDP-4-dehydrorhamnose 3,5-epimerase [Gemmatimonas sp.]
MKLIATPLNDVFIVEAPVHADARGYFNEIYQAEKFATLGLTMRFVQDNHSYSKRDVLRGMHFQRHEPQGKLVQIVHGSIFDVAVDLRKSSSTFGQWFGTEFHAGDGRQLWIPAGLAHGFAVLSDTASVAYKCTAFYNAVSEVTLAWNDKKIGINWPAPRGEQFHLSAKDASGTPFASLDPLP